MFLDTRKLLRPGAEPLGGQAEIDLSAGDFNGYSIPNPVALAWRAEPLHGQVRLVVAVDATIAAECARCLAPASQALHVDQTYLFTAQDTQEAYPLLPFLPDGTLDMAELVYGEIVMEAPGALLCSDACPGLCQHCGRPVAACRCPPRDEGDPRLAVLRQLLNDNDT